MRNCITDVYCIVKDETVRESEEEVAPDVLQVLSLHFVGLFNRNDCQFLCGHSPSWVNHIILVSLLYCIYVFFLLGVLDTFRQLSDILHIGHMEGVCLMLEK